MFRKRYLTIHETSDAKARTINILVTVNRELSCVERMIQTAW